MQASCRVRRPVYRLTSYIRIEACFIVSAGDTHGVNTRYIRVRDFGLHEKRDDHLLHPFFYPWTKNKIKLTLIKIPIYRHTLLQIFTHLAKCHAYAVE